MNMKEKEREMSEEDVEEKIYLNQIIHFGNVLMFYQHGA